MTKLDVVVKCPCGNEMETTWIKGSMMDWQCDECGKRLGMQFMRVKGDDNE